MNEESLHLTPLFFKYSKESEKNPQTLFRIGDMDQLRGLSILMETEF